jgi:adhesin/invasin
VLAKVSGDAQTVAAGSAVQLAPRVKVTSSNGTPLSGVQVTFAVASGGGMINGASATTGSSGEAVVGSWTTGVTAGANTLTASVVDASPGTVTFSATGVAGSAALLSPTAGNGQRALVHTAVPLRPQVKVTDAHGNPVSGASVTFAVTGGGGTVIDGTQLSAADGTATVGGWILGSVGVNTLAAAVTGGADPAVFTATGDELLFQPPNDTSLAGTVSVTRFIIPAGRTVTATGPLVIDSDSTVSIDGTLRGDCVSILIKGRETVTISGALDNSCIAESRPRRTSESWRLSGIPSKTLTSRPPGTSS